MKLSVALFGLFSAVIVACALFLSNKLGTVSVADEATNLCTGNKACMQAAASIFSEEAYKTATDTATLPAGGYCLQVPVLLYHHIQPQADAVAKGQTSLSVDSGEFDKQMAYLAGNGYTTISAQQLVDAILSHGQVPSKSVVVTMDDGYLDNYLYAYPTLQKYHLLGNLMVPTGLLGVVAGTNSYFSWDQLKEMVGSRTMVAYNHTWSHFPMAQGSKEKDIQEITTAQNQLRQFLGTTSPILVYPYGSGQTVSWVWQLLKDNGYVAAFSTLPGRFQCEGNIFSLPRIHIGNAPLSSYGI
ncbi:MAG TPA: polysaccharide deacetylase family protein [Patescibacteria group bacterium]|nr:polysaccharide deacetylase family protein [Patescibacteria group bacterium]